MQQLCPCSRLSTTELLGSVLTRHRAAWAMPGGCGEPFHSWHLPELLAKVALVPSIVPMSVRMLAGCDAGARCLHPPRGSRRGWHGLATSRAASCP